MSLQDLKATTPSVDVVVTEILKFAEERKVTGGFKDSESLKVRHP